MTNTGILGTDIADLRSDIPSLRSPVVEQERMRIGG